MQTAIQPSVLATPEGQEAESILRACVHCGFCTATCPTYQLLGDELDGPRGRIYQIKLVLEGDEPTPRTQLHLDRCLTCRSCETTCPSGVRYARLLDIGRHYVATRLKRPLADRLLRRAMVAVLPHPSRFERMLALGEAMRPLLPRALKSKLPERKAAGAWPQQAGGRTMIALAGCVQSVVTPDTNAALARVLARLSVDLVEVPEAGCCGALAYHSDAREAGLAAIRRNIDAWWPMIERGAEAILIGASGCGAFIKEYGEILSHDSDYAERARRVSELAKDPIEVLADADLAPLGEPGRGRKVAFHSPCSLQHGQGIRNRVEAVLARLGYSLTVVQDAHLCCGSAGAYSITQPKLSVELRDNKVAALTEATPDLIATANIGCQMHLAAGTGTPVVHWLTLLEEPPGD